MVECVPYPNQFHALALKTVFINYAGACYKAQCVVTPWNLSGRKTTQFCDAHAHRWSFEVRDKNMGKVAVHCVVQAANLCALKCCIAKTSSPLSAYGRNIAIRIC